MIEDVGLRVADEARGRHAVHHRHLDVHENEVVVPARQSIDGRSSVIDGIGGVAHALEGLEGDLPVDGVILGDQYPHASLVPIGEAVPGDDARGRCDLVRRPPVEHDHQAIEQLRLLDRLGEVRGEPELFEAVGVAAAPHGGHHDEPHISQVRIGLDRTPELLAVHLRHHHVEYGDIERVILGARRAQLLEGGRGAVHLDVATAP